MHTHLDKIAGSARKAMFPFYAAIAADMPRPSDRSDAALSPRELRRIVAEMLG